MPSLHEIGEFTGDAGRLLLRDSASPMLFLGGRIVKFSSLLPILQVTKSFKVRGATYKVLTCACLLHTSRLETYGVLRAQCISCAGCLLACGQSARRDLLIREPCTCCASCMPGNPEKVMAFMAIRHSMCLSGACFVPACEALWLDSPSPRQISQGSARFL